MTLPYKVSSTIIQATHASKQIRFTNTSSIIDTYNSIMDNMHPPIMDNLHPPLRISKDIIQDEAFHALWIELHNNLVDRFYTKYGEAAFNDMVTPPTNTSNNDLFHDWPECKVELAIDPLLQEKLAKRVVHRRPKLVVTKDIIDKVLAEKK